MFRSTKIHSLRFFADSDRAERFRTWLKLRILGLKYDELEFELQRLCALRGGFMFCVDQAFEALRNGFKVECRKCPLC